MFGFGKRFYAPIYVIALILIGMVLIYLSESFGLSHRTINLDLRNANSIILADKIIQKQSSQHSKVTQMKTNSDLIGNYHYNNNININNRGNCKYSDSNNNENTFSNSFKCPDFEVNQIKRINMILINSVA